MTRSLPWSLTPDDRAPAQARTHLTCHFTAHCPGAGADVLDTALLLVSEVVTNAVRHGSGAVTLQVDDCPEGLHVDVSDELAGMPGPPRPLDPDAENGRGLFLVDALADCWGVRCAPAPGGPADVVGPPGPGKTVWFEVAAPCAG